MIFWCSRRTSRRCACHSFSRFLAGSLRKASVRPIIRSVSSSVGTRCVRRSPSSWITSAPTQGTIADFGVEEYGEPLFFPDAGK